MLTRIDIREKKQLINKFSFSKATGKLPDIPKDEDGGSEAIDFNYFPRHEDDSKQRKSPLYGTVPKVGKKRSKKSKKKSGKTEDKASVKEVPKKLLQFQPSRTLGDINASAQRYKGQRFTLPQGKFRHQTY